MFLACVSCRLEWKMETELVLIKSYPNGILVNINQEAEFGEVIKELAVKFRKSSGFFKDATLVLSIEGRELSIAEEHTVVQTIEENSELSICSIVGKDKQKEIFFEKRMELLKQMARQNQVVVKENRIITGCVSSGQSIESDSTIIVIGDVLKGASVVSEKDVIILGTLYGEAIAGVDKKKNHFVYATCMQPESVGIGNMIREFDKKELKKMKKDVQLICLKGQDLHLQKLDQYVFEDEIC